MLEGQEISVLLKLELENQFTIGAEFYGKTFIQSLKTLKKSSLKIVNLSEIASLITDGDHGAPDYKESGVLYLLSESIKEGYIDENIYRYISPKLHKELKRSSLHKGDVLVTKTGIYFGKSAVIPENFPEANTSAHVGKISIKDGKINPYFLSTFINSCYGYLQFRRRGIKATRPEIKLIEFNDIKIGIPSTLLQDKIESIIKKANELRHKSFETYANIETVLLEIIGLNNFTPSTNNINIKSLGDSFLTSGRLDAEYYQPKYEEIITAIKANKNGNNMLVDFIANYSTGYPYKSESYAEEGIPIIRINNIKLGELDLSNAAKVPFSDISLSPKDIANENDILISMSGTIGSSCKIPKGIKALVNQRIMRITPQKYNFDVLPFIINSVIGQYQLERIGTGGVQTNISSKDIKEILIPVIEKGQLLRIESLINESFSLKKRSEYILDVAKKAVEMAIEENEEKAMKYIKDNIN